MMEKRFKKLSRISLAKRQPGSSRPAGILHPIAADGYLWIRHAQNMVKNGHWRLNHTDFDNAPHGRDVHWHTGFAGWLIGTGWINHMFNGISIDRAIAGSAVWANSIILACCLLLLPFLAYRRFGVRPAMALALGMLACKEFYENFIPAYPDHHGVISLTALLSVLFLLMAGAGWTRDKATGYMSTLFPQTDKEARLWIYPAAFFSAAALWASAVSQILLMVGLALGIVGSVALFNKKARTEGLRYNPEIWAFWGRVGAICSLLFYALEYFPDRMGMQLLVNHPLHALAWLGGCEVLAIITRCVYEARRLSKKEWYWLAAGMFLIVLFPAAIVSGDSSWWSLRDPFMVALHKNILEFQPLLPRLKNGSLNVWGWVWSQLFFLLPGVVLLFLRRIPAGCRAMILFCLAPALLFTALSFYQTRWSIHCGSVYLCLLVIVLYILLNHLAQTGSHGNNFAWSLFAAVIIILSISPIRVLRKAHSISAPTKRLMLSLGEGRDLLARDIALTINRFTQGKKVTVLSSPNTTLRTCYFGNFSGMGTLYWENLPGLKAAAELFSIPDMAKAKQLIKYRGITHIVFVDAQHAMSPYVETYFDLYNLEHKRAKLEDGFAFNLFYKRNIPPWLRRIPYPKNVLTNLLQAEVLLLEVGE
jgi:asparagine N-glycosylation enzyme membrane subunit Stt3